MKKLFSLVTAAALCTVFASCDKLPVKGAASGGGDAKKAKPSMAMPVPVVRVGSVGEINEINSRKYVGRIMPIEDVELKARVSGNIVSIKFKEGDYVKAGDLLIEIEDTTYKASLLASEAKLQQAEAELVNAKQKYDRQLDLSNSNIATKSELEDATKSLHLAMAVKSAAEASLIDARNNYSYTKIYAPISGKIGKAAYTFGNYVTPASEPLARIIQFAPLYVCFSISEPDYIGNFGNVDALKKKALVRLRTADRKMASEQGRITLVDNKVDAETGTIMMWATFPNAGEYLTPGGVVDVIMSKQVEKKYPCIPVSALLVGKNEFYVYVLGEGNSAQKRVIEIGGTAGDVQIVTSGLTVGETIITDGTHKVMMPGMPVKALYPDGKIVEPPQAPTAPPAAHTDAAPAKESK